ncbi:hypothetical protein J6590_067252 [Homalodisca vitripennis]|nr:hypothetical protein J6590_067252 [Homalodisca vitripennis]
MKLTPGISSLVRLKGSKAVGDEEQKRNPRIAFTSETPGLQKEVQSRSDHGTWSPEEASSQSAPFRRIRSVECVMSRMKLPNTCYLIVLQ